MIRIEYLYPEVCNLYGDIFNIKYLKSCLKEAEVIETSLTEKPRFIDEDIDMIYMGTMTEKTQEIVIEKLTPYKDELQKAIDNNKLILLTGNAFEVFGKYIENEDGSKIEGLGLIDTYSKRDMMHRYNTLFLGEFNDETLEEPIKIMGFKSIFAFSYGDNENNYLFKSIKGCGINKASKLEGIRINNLFGTYIIGPLLIVNPEFTKYIMKLLGEENPKIQFEDEANKCFEERIKEFERESTNYLQ